MTARGFPTANQMTAIQSQIIKHRRTAVLTWFSNSFKRLSCFE